MEEPKGYEEIRDHSARQIARLGAAMLAKDNDINIITYAQFEPHMWLFQGDYSNVEPNSPEGRRIALAVEQYRIQCEINPYEPTIVVASETDPTELYFLDRYMTRILSDAAPSENSARSKVPGGVSRASEITREDLMIAASRDDTLNANNTAEQKRYFAMSRALSAIIQKNFHERNKAAPTKTMEDPTNTEVASTPVADTSGYGDMEFGLDD